MRAARSRPRRGAAAAALVIVASLSAGVALSACGASDNGGTIQGPGSSTSVPGGASSTTSAATIPGGG